MGNIYPTWRGFPPGAWRWPDFSPQEMACRGTGRLMIDESSMDKLQALRTMIGRPIVVSSAYRSPEHNRAVGGAPSSQHLKAKAFDCRMDNHDPVAFEAAARKCGFTGFGYYPKQGFMHIDTGPARIWGQPFPKRAPTPQFRTETRREMIKDLLKRPEVLIPAAGTGIGAAAPVAQGNGPVQIALAIGFVIVICAFAALLITKVMTRPRDV